MSVAVGDTVLYVSYTGEINKPNTTQLPEVKCTRTRSVSVHVSLSFQRVNKVSVFTSFTPDDRSRVTRPLTASAPQ